MQRTYFLGGTSADGFKTRFEEIILSKGYYTYILKGGPGTGKSTLMKKINQHFHEYEPDLYYCSSDIRSLDAVVIEPLGAVIVDGTAPHIFNASFPGIGQCLVDLGTSWDAAILQKNEADIRRCTAENSSYHASARALATALSAVNGSIASHSGVIDNAAIKAKAIELANTVPSINEISQCRYKQLSAITDIGYCTKDAPPDYDVRGITDSRYAAGFALMSLLLEHLLESGHDLVASECVLFPQHGIEHIMLPDLKIQFSLLTPLNKLVYSTIASCDEFYSGGITDSELLRRQSIAHSLENETASAIRRALEIHDELESFYIEALDFAKLDRITENLIQSIERHK